MEVTDENFLLQGPDIGVQEMKPVLLVFYLVHVDVSRWDVFIPTLQSGILRMKQELFRPFTSLSEGWKCYTTFPLAVDTMCTVAFV